MLSFSSYGSRRDARCHCAVPNSLRGARYNGAYSDSRQQQQRHGAPRGSCIELRQTPSGRACRKSVTTADEEQASLAAEKASAEGTAVPFRFVWQPFCFALRSVRVLLRPGRRRPTEQTCRQPVRLARRCGSQTSVYCVSALNCHSTAPYTAAATAALRTNTGHAAAPSGEGVSRDWASSSGLNFRKRSQRRGLNIQLID